MVNQKLIYHAVIFDQTHHCFLDNVDRASLHRFLEGWCQQTGLKVLSIGSHANHLHVLFEQISELSLQYLMRLIVRKTEQWLEGVPEIQQQVPPIELDFGVFTVSYSAIDKISNFVASQESHHSHVSFEEEFIALLDKHHVQEESVRTIGVKERIISGNRMQSGQPVKLKQPADLSPSGKAGQRIA